MKWMERIPLTSVIISLIIREFVKCLKGEYINSIVKSEVVGKRSYMKPNFIYCKSWMFTSKLTYERCAIF